MQGPDAHVQSGGVYVQTRLLMYSAACSCAAARAYVHGRLFICRIPLHVCTTSCLFAAGLACIHGGVSICKGPCTYSVVLICTRLVLVRRAVCLFARRRRVHVFTRSLLVLPVQSGHSDLHHRCTDAADREEA